MASALAWIALGHHEAVRVYLLGKGSASPLPPVSSRSAAAALFRQLAMTKEEGPTDLVASLRMPSRDLTAGPLFLLTDLLDPRWSEALDALTGVREAAVLQLLAPAEWEPPLGEEVELEDAETGELRPTRLGPMEIAAYRARLDGFVDSVRRQCARIGLPHLAVNTSASLQETVLRHLPRAGLLTG